MSMISYCPPLLFAATGTNNNRNYGTINSSNSNNFNGSDFRVSTRPNLQSKGIVRRIKGCVKNNWGPILGILTLGGSTIGYIASQVIEARHKYSAGAYDHNTDNAYTLDNKEGVFKHPYSSHSQPLGIAKHDGYYLDENNCTKSFTAYNPKNNDSMLLFNVLGCHSKQIDKNPYADIAKQGSFYGATDYSIACLDQKGNRTLQSLDVTHYRNKDDRLRLGAFVAGVMNDLRLCTPTTLKEIVVKKLTKGSRRKAKRNHAILG